MSEDLQQLHRWADGLLVKLSPASRTQLAREIARSLRQSQSQRIAAQKNPDGSSFAPRKPQLRSKKGKIRRQMFRKLRTARYMKGKGDGQGVTISFLSSVRHMAAVHQYGLRDRVNRYGLEVDYAQRQLLGVSAEDVRKIEALIVHFLT
ncbi:phage virion morphogenesis protein [Escherichia coli]|uniref:Phage virion morphogenesis protein n=1 Tax=Escherichia coli TaxID=562 RepID=A0A2K3TWE1_ECOLX|nr:MULTISPECIES: phage virion morphogenesis protein [Escherichia]EGI4719165.1 phage virion morphogenesis protein [Escherichia coli]EGO5044324.1 phage virion morphogenesis protein [Escherichia coli]EGO6115197.1 phage virion morphogenesis protein [Escherichia coli]EGO6708226.1 phage virion morphogenesis protein [Escherichia coli]EGO6740630.1 phage virion morphogenesis protein [Escherichia coli]